jgi:hypothetical protein
MDNRELEKKITATIAKEFGFTLTKSGKYYACNQCGKRFMVDRITYVSGHDTNNAMIEHYKTHWNK